MDNQSEVPKQSFQLPSTEHHKMDKKGAKQSKAKTEFGRFQMHHTDDNNEAGMIDQCFLSLSTGSEL